jgi:hypothetical protein
MGLDASSLRGAVKCECQVKWAVSKSTDDACKTIRGEQEHLGGFEVATRRMLASFYGQQKCTWFGLAVARLRHGGPRRAGLRLIAKSAPKLRSIPVLLIEEKALIILSDSSDQVVAPWQIFQPYRLWPTWPSSSRGYFAAATSSRGSERYMNGLEEAVFVSRSTDQTLYAAFLDHAVWSAMMVVEQACVWFSKFPLQ